MGEIHNEPSDSGIDIIGALKGIGSSVLKEVIKLTPFGGPDKELNHRELLEIYVDYVDTLVSRDPAFGKTPEGFSGLPHDCRDACLTVFDYLYDMPEVYGYPVIDARILYHEIGFEGRDVTELIQGNVLMDAGGDSPGDYILQKPYYDFWTVESAKLARKELEEIYRFDAYRG